jgi:hypothetical protein
MISAAQLSWADEREQQLQEILENSGVVNAVESLPGLYAQQIQREGLRNNFDDASKQQLSQQVAVKPEVLLDALKQYLLREAGDEPLQGVQTALKSPIIEKLRRFENMAGTPQQREKLRNFTPSSPLTEERLELLRETNTVSYTVAIIALLQSYAEVNTAVAADNMRERFIAKRDPNGVELWRNALEKHYRNELANQADDYLAFSYRFIRDAQLSEYIVQWQDKNLQWFMQMVIAGLHDVLHARQAVLYE